MSINSDTEREGIRHVGRIVAEALEAMRRSVRAGVTTRELDHIGVIELRRHGAKSAPREVYRFPGCSCISINDEIVHGVPSDRRLSAGDMVKLDVTAICDGYVADAADTIVLAPAPARARRLRECAEQAFWEGVRVARVGTRVNAIGQAVERCVKSDGFAVVRELCGHGVGRTIHEPPEVPNYFNPRQTDVLSDGLVITIEPLLSARASHAVKRLDGWTIATGNGSLAAHYEHTIIIGRDAPEIVTARA